MKTGVPGGVGEFLVVGDQLVWLERPENLQEAETRPAAA